MKPRFLAQTLGPLMIALSCPVLSDRPANRALCFNPSAGATALPSLSLAEARRRAFGQNWDLLAARSDVDAATAQKLIAHEFPNPTVSLSSAEDQHRTTSRGARRRGTIYGTAITTPLRRSTSSLKSAANVPAAEAFDRRRQIAELPRRGWRMPAPVCIDLGVTWPICMRALLCRCSNVWKF